MLEKLVTFINSPLLNTFFLTYPPFNNLNCIFLYRRLTTTTTMTTRPTARATTTTTMAASLPDPTQDLRVLMKTLTLTMTTHRIQCKLTISGHRLQCKLTISGHRFSKLLSSSRVFQCKITSN